MLVFDSSAGPTSYLFADADHAYYIDWRAHGTGTLWATYVNPQEAFQVESGNTGVTVTLQGSAVSIQAPDSSTPTLGQRSGKHLALSLDGGGGFGPWTGNFTFTPGSLKGYEGAVNTVQQTGATIASSASRYASQDVADANAAATTSTDGDCILYLSGTDVSVTVNDGGGGASLCSDVVLPYGDLGSGGTWSSQQSGANYAGQASLVCEYADSPGTEFVVVADAGFKQYGGNVCDDLGNAGDWYAIRSSS